GQGYDRFAGDDGGRDLGGVGVRAADVCSLHRDRWGGAAGAAAVAAAGDDCWPGGELVGDAGVARRGGDRAEVDERPVAPHDLDADVEEAPQGPAQGYVLLGIDRRRYPAGWRGWCPSPAEGQLGLPGDGFGV